MDRGFEVEFDEDFAVLWCGVLWCGMLRDR